MSTLPRMQMILPWTRSNGYASLLDDYAFDAGGVKGVVPKWFISNGLSIPLVLRGIIQPWGRYWIAGIVHDWLYFLAGRTGVDRETSDGVLRAICESIDGETAGEEMWIALREFGGVAWKLCKEPSHDAEVAMRLEKGGSAELCPPTPNFLPTTPKLGATP